MRGSPWFLPSVWTAADPHHPTENQLLVETCPALNAGNSVELGTALEHLLQTVQCFPTKFRQAVTGVGAIGLGQSQLPVSPRTLPMSLTRELTPVQKPAHHVRLPCSEHVLAPLH